MGDNVASGGGARKKRNIKSHLLITKSHIIKSHPGTNHQASCYLNGAGRQELIMLNTLVGFVDIATPN